MRKTKILLAIILVSIVLLIIPNVSNAAVEVTRNVYSNNGSMKFNFTGLTLDTTKEYEFGITKTSAAEVETWHLITEYTENTATVDISMNTEDLRNIVDTTDTAYIRIREKSADTLVLEPYAVDVKTQVFPGFATDLQQPITTLLTQAHGISHIEETIYENRFQNIKELEKMGLKAKVSSDNKQAKIYGITKLHGADVCSTDLRGGASLLVAALIAEGTTTIDNINYILRGYDKIVEKLKSVGAKIELI